LEQGLILHIDNIPERETAATALKVSWIVQSDRVRQIESEKAVSPTPRDLTEDKRLDRILESAERVIGESFRDRNILQPGRVNPLRTTKTQLRKARQVKRLQEENRKKEVERNQGLQELRAKVISRLNKN
jgi:hypothetical protein